MQHAEQRPIKAREKLDFQLDSGVPRFWNGGDPFKTRFFDVMSLTFPIGERYFISSVRHYRDQITDPGLLQEVKDFTRQEAQHGIVHTQFNQMLEKQGLNIGWTQRVLDTKFNLHLKHLSPKFNVAYTAAAEHLTAMMCSTFFERPDILAPFDHRIRAMYIWHSIEEVEHKAVAFDVMTQVAKVGYFTRIAALLCFSIEYPIANLYTINRMLKDDGFGWWSRARMWAKGLWWLYKPGGVFMPAMGYYFSYFRPNFHPWQHKEMGHYDAWLTAFNRSGNPIDAADHYSAQVLALNP
jgi:uncharacterized protein